MVLLRIAAVIDGMNRHIGWVVRWLILGSVATCFLVAVLRYLFSFGFVWFQELYVWQYAVAFMLGSAYTLLVGGHVRVDVLYRRRTARGRAWTDLLGTLLFLFPWLGLILVTSWSFVSVSWRVGESSPQYGGLPAVYLLKTTILVFAVLLFLQGLSVVIRRTLFLLRQIPAEQGLGQSDSGAE